MRSKYNHTPKTGVVELMGQTAQMIWPKVEGKIVVENRKQFQVMPLFLRQTTGSCQLAALEQGMPELSLSSLIDMTKTMKCIVVNLSSDLAPSCQRLKFAVAERMLSHNASVLLRTQGQDVIILIDSQCVGHILHTIAEKVFSHTTLMPNLHSTAWLCTMPGTYAEMMRALEQIVREDLEEGFFPCCEPPPEHMETNRVLAEMTVLAADSAKARQEDGVNSIREELANELCEVCTGNWTCGTVQHFCHKNGCCNGHRREVAVQRIVAVIAQAFFGGLATDIPSTTRWYTFLPQCSAQCGGMLCHNLMVRVLQRSMHICEEKVNNGEFKTIRAARVFFLRSKSLKT